MSEEAEFIALASQVSAFCAERIEEGQLDRIDDAALGQILAAVVRAYAAKVQQTDTAQPFGGNSTMTPTDVAIACTAMLDSVQMPVFELAMWQDMSGLGKLKKTSPSAEGRGR
jgi:hypothetical protein